MTHLGDVKVTLQDKEVRIKFGMLFWKLLLKHYNMEFSQIGYLIKTNMDKLDFVSSIVLFGHKAYCELAQIEQVYTDAVLVELVNDTLTDDELAPIVAALLDSKMLGKSLIQTFEDSKKKE